MKIVALSIPDDPTQWAGWLEQQLVGLHLYELVEELKVFHQFPDDPALNLNGVCGGQLARVFESGLSALSDAQVRLLLKTPRLLLELQEQVLEHGGTYWTQLPRSDEQQQKLAESWQKLSASLADTTIARDASMSRRQVLRRMSLAGAAAVVAVGVGLWFLQPTGPNWGFDRPGAFTAKLGGPAYCRHLARLVQDDWTATRWQNAESLERSLRDFIHGCDSLLAAPHPQFAQDADRKWLKDRCQLWRGKLSVQLADLKSGKRPFAAVRDDTNTTVRNLINALNKQAEKVS